jgi:hypothetical protein
VEEDDDYYALPGSNKKTSFDDQIQPKNQLSNSPFRKNNFDEDADLNSIPTQSKFKKQPKKISC